MVFTNEDLKRIGKNVAAIRKAYGFKSSLKFAIALDPNGRFQGLSHDTIKKIESGKYQITEETIRLIASLTSFTFEEIAFRDLGYLKPNSMVFNNINPNEVLFDKETLSEIANLVKGLYPLFSSEEALKTESFNKAYSYSINELDINTLTQDEYMKMLEMLESFEQSPFPESYANILSILGRFYVIRLYFAIEKDTLQELNKHKYDTLLDFNKKLYHLRLYDKQKNFFENGKRLFLEGFNYMLTKYMKKLLEYDCFKDYVYYYLATRYYFGIMDNEITKINDTDMNTFGISMLDCLDKLDNKYAKNFLKLFDEKVH